MTERDKMLAGLLYDCGDRELLARWHKAKDLMRNYNQTDSANIQEKERILNELLGAQGNERKQIIFTEMTRSRKPMRRFPALHFYLSKRAPHTNALIVLRRIIAHNFRFFHADLKMLFHKINCRQDGQKRIPLAAAGTANRPDLFQGFCSH